MCNDPFLTYLKAFGYCVIRLPRRRFDTLQILMRQKNDLIALGDLGTALIAGSEAPLPSIRRNEAAATISGKSTSRLSIGVGVSILGSVLGAMGGSKIGLDAQYRKAKTISFEFTGVLKDSVAIAELDQFLGAADLNPNSRHVADLLEADEIYVVTETIKSKSFTVDAHGAGSGEAAIKLPEIQKLVGGKVKVTAADAQTSKITYQSAEPLVFGFQAIRLFYDDARYSAFEPLPSGELAARAFNSRLPAGVHALQSAGAFARMSTA
jgi:hypothetical protein